MLGGYISKSQSIDNKNPYLGILRYGSECIKANAVQIFLKSPQSTKHKTNITEEDAAACKQYLKDKKMFLVIHASYILNFSKEVGSAAKWKLDNLIEDLIWANKMGAVGAIIHMGKQLTLTYDQAIDNKVENIGVAIDYIKEHKLKSKIILENSAHQGTETCWNVQQLGELWSKFTTSQKKHLGFCIDTCHLFAAGIDISTEKGVKAFFSEWANVIGWKNVICIHMNDCKHTVGSRKDRHENFKGDNAHIKSGLRHFCRMAVEKEIPIILETPDTEQYKTEIETMRKWIA